jgi:NADH-quinone oxidoreductase subunit N
MAMYTKEPNEERTGTPVVIYAVAYDCINIALGLFPSFVLDLLA